MGVQAPGPAGGPAKERTETVPLEEKVEKSCPACGASTSVAEETVPLLRGSCAACGRAFTILTEPLLVAGGAPPAEGPAPGEEPGAGSFPAIPCRVCGGTLTWRAEGDGDLEARCAACSTTFAYVLAGRPPEREERSFPPRGRFPRKERGGPEPSRARPCRECGGPLRFSTDDDGNVTGECESCGNRFTLPPRRGFGPARAGRGRFDRSDRPPFRRGGRYGGDRSEDRPRFRSGRPPFRPRERDEESDDYPKNRRRRRPRPE